MAHKLETTTLLQEVEEEENSTEESSLYSQGIDPEEEDPIEVDIESMETTPGGLQKEEADQKITSPGTIDKRKRAGSRWDKTARASKQARTQKTESEKEYSNEGKENSNPLKIYKSWRRWRSLIYESLLNSGGNISFVRRYMLFKHGVDVPSSVIRYYNSCRPGL
ncbi:22 kDa protein [red squirrel adenovirus 1]|uniref:22 kDa protein n=1 Tax=red squirrel adenovirus 1 TaxID=2773314 RepID=A0A220A468_9ADEN|nr:22 kDa protein [red squirrel adenovirus 1]ARE31893.1 22 kDa protein [red squirrel adenovirus 1]WUG45434.1 22K [Squirrel mastadenovirus A]